MIINCYDDWYSLDVKTMVSVSDATEIGVNYSIELSINDINKNTTKYYVLAMIITCVKWNYRWICFTEEFVRSRIILNDDNLIYSGIEVMHVFINKTRKRSLWIASLGMGLSIMVVIILLSNTYYLVDIVILKNNKHISMLSN